MRIPILPFLVLLSGALFFVIPSLGTSVFLSPDETANAVAARTFAQTGHMRVENHLLTKFPWLHPRSFVTQGTAMVPVGFLGFPALLAIVWKMIGEWGLVLFTPLLAISTVYPLWRCSARWGRRSQIATVVTWLSFPTVILYANRGLFANLPVVCLTLWAWILVLEKRTPTRSVVAGLCVGFALAMRPTEAIWIVPWLGIAWMCRRDRPRHVEWRPLIFFLLSACVPIAFTMVVAWKTYGSPVTIGYFLRDPIIGMTPDARLPTPDVIRWPFGFHPMNVLKNIWSYHIRTLGLWSAVSIATLVVFWKKQDARPHLLVGVWTMLVLTLMYGQALYQDHVGVNVVSFGNSFLRYLLPMSVFAALATGALVTKLSNSLAVALVTILIVSGTNLAMRGDAESVLPSRQELQRYRVIRDAAIEKLGTHAIILSERSDKIFFPTFRVGSPMPGPVLNNEKVTSLFDEVADPIAVLTETLDKQTVASSIKGAYGLEDVFQNKNQTLYVLDRLR